MAPAAVSSERTVYVAAIESKGEAAVADEAFPADPLPGGGGYVLEEPDAEGNWVVETYRWLPSQITVVEGGRGDPGVPRCQRRTPPGHP